MALATEIGDSTFQLMLAGTGGIDIQNDIADRTK